MRTDQVVQVERRTKEIRDAAGVRAKFGVDPPRIPDLLALVGDSADGYPGIPGIGKVGADPRCTMEDKALYSYRRDGRTGRQAAITWLDPRPA